MRCCTLLFAAIIAMQAGTISGVVMEQASSRPLARAVVRLQPIPRPGDGPVKSATVRAGRSGSFTFPVVAPGLYLVEASKEGYFPVQFGQRIPIGRGIPIEVTADSNTFAELRLRHKGAITGRVLDENGVATSGVPVVAYRAQLPLRSAASGISDDRGVYRIAGLEPGKYWVRSKAHILDDGSAWLPTFGPQSREIRDARIHRVTVDADTTDADVSPDAGSLFRLGGIIQCEAGAVTVVLSSETDRRTMSSSCRASYQFEALAPGFYEVFAQSQDGAYAGFIETYVDRDNNSSTVQLFPLQAIEFQINPPSAKNVQIFARRQDMSEIGAEREITNLRTPLAPGNWEFRATAPKGSYIESIQAFRGSSRRRYRAERPPDWFDVSLDLGMYPRVIVTVSDKAAQVEGKVTADGKPVPGAPVYLWPSGEQNRRSLGGWKLTLTDSAGNYSFDSLPPGEYQMLSSFDIYEPDADLLQAAHAPILRLAPSAKTAQNLSLWNAAY